ncbi:MAG: FAD-binding oxidoreductase [Pseudomonadota bacterium]
MTGYLTANDRPGEHAESWYAATAGPFPDHPVLGEDTSAEVCVIGGGFAGLSTALHLAGQGVDVMVLEANRIGWGASGRNGGQLGFGQRKGPEAYEKVIGKASARRVWSLGNSANQLVRDLIREHQIECELVENGYLDAAIRPAHARDFRDYPAFLADEYGHETARYVEREEMAEMLGTTAYHGGIFDTRGAHLHPLKYALGLGRAAHAKGARIHERSRVTKVSLGLVETETGTVRADHIVLAMNGYIDGLVPKAARRTIAINNFVAATEPLGETRAWQVIRDNIAVCDSKFVLNYFRLTPDHRLLWGGGESYGRRFPRDIPGLVRRAMLEIFPQLGDVPFTHAWGGTLAITAPRFPVFKEWEGRLWSISGWSGSGIHMATMGGKAVADAIRGDRADWEMMSNLPVPPFPGGDWFRAPLVAAAMTWYGFRDRL